MDTHSHKPPFIKLLNDAIGDSIPEDISPDSSSITNNYNHSSIQVGVLPPSLVQIPSGDEWDREVAGINEKFGAKKPSALQSTFLAMPLADKRNALGKSFMMRPRPMTELGPLMEAAMNNNNNSSSMSHRSSSPTSAGGGGMSNRLFTAVGTSRLHLSSPNHHSHHLTHNHHVRAMSFSGGIGGIIGGSGQLLQLESSLRSLTEMSLPAVTGPRRFRAPRINRFVPDYATPKKPSWNEKPVMIVPGDLARTLHFTESIMAGAEWCNYADKPLPTNKMFGMLHVAVHRQARMYYSANQLLNCFHVFSRGAVFVTYVRWAHQLKIMGLSLMMREVDCKWLFNFFDSNHDGEVGFTEFCKQWNRSLLLAFDEAVDELFSAA